MPESAICGVDVSILDWGSDELAPWSIDEITVSAITDPVQNWINGYVNAATAIAGGQAGRVAFGTDFNGLNGLMEISENAVPAGASSRRRLASVSKGDSPKNDAGPLPLAPMRFRYSDGTLGNQVLIDERGLATYGLLADLLAILPTHSACGQSVHDSLMLSAEATIRAWEAIENPTRAAPTMPVMTFPCGGGATRGTRTRRRAKTPGRSTRRGPYGEVLRTLPRHRRDALLAYVPRVDADEPALFDQLTAPTTRPEHCPPRAGYFDGLASACHVWEIRTDTGFSAGRVLTERLEVASAIPIFRQTFALVLRTTASVDSQTTTGFYGIHGPIWSVGFRNRSPENNYWIEAGVRLVPGWAGPKDDQPQALQLAYQAAITSGVGDDARPAPV